MSSSGKFFDDFADTFDTLYDGKRTRLMRWVDQRFRRDMFIRFRMTFEYVGDLSDITVIDIGCGSGPYVAEALKRGALHATGIDPAPRMLELAKQRVTRLGKQERSTFLEGYFPVTCPLTLSDFGVVMGVMDYVPAPLTFLQKLPDIVEQSVAISFPSTHWFRTPFRKLRYRLRDVPVYFYTQEKIEALLHKAELKNYQIEKISGAGMDYFVWITL
jgi:SAM-dependent methyltransferase